MRTTLDIDEDILEAVREMAVQERSTAGKVLSNLVRRALARERRNDVRNGVPVLPPRAGERLVTAEEVARLLGTSDDP